LRGYPSPYFLAVGKKNFCKIGRNFLKIPISAENSAEIRQRFCKIYEVHPPPPLMNRGSGQPLFIVKKRKRTKFYQGIKSFLLAVSLLYPCKP